MPVGFNVLTSPSARPRPNVMTPEEINRIRMAFSDTECSKTSMY